MKLRCLGRHCYTNPYMHVLLSRGHLISLPPFPHSQYVRFAHNRFRRYGGLRTDQRHFLVRQKLQQTNLDLAYPLLSVLYSSRQGRPARDPVSMLRSCLAMMECGVTSFDVWVKMMHDEALLCHHQWLRSTRYPRRRHLLRFPGSPPPTSASVPNYALSPAPPSPQKGQSRSTQEQERPTFPLRYRQSLGGSHPGSQLHITTPGCHPRRLWRLLCSPSF